MSVAPQSHTWKFTDTETNLHTLPCSLSASSALSAMKIYIKKWVSQCYFPHILLAAAHAFLELSFSLLPPLQLVRIFFSGFIYDFLSENPCISFVFNILKFSNSGFFQSSAAWLMANTLELRFLHYPGWFVCLETLIAAFPPFYSVTSPNTFFKRFYLMFVTLKLLVLTATWTSLELSLEKEMIIPGEPSCLPSLSGTTASCLSATNLQQQLFISHFFAQ